MAEMCDREVVVYKAQPLTTLHRVPDLAIVARESFPELPSTSTSVLLERNRAMHVDDAEAIVNALQQCLPGGTFDQVLRIMLERKASHFIVPHIDTIQAEEARP